MANSLGEESSRVCPNFTSIPFDYLLISWVTNYVHNRGFLTCLSCIVSIDNSTLSKGFDKIPVKILLDVLFRVFRFSRASFNALTSSFIVLKLRRHLCTETYEGFHGNFIFSHVKLPCEIRHLWYYNSQLSFFESITKLQNPRQIRWTKYPKSRFNMTYCLSTKLFNPWQLRE